MAGKGKTQVEVLLVGADLNGIKLQPHLVKTTRLVTVEMLWPRASIAKKTSARELKFQKAQSSCAGEEWCRRILFREEVEGHTGFAVTVSELLDDEWFEKFLRLTAKYALKTAADFVNKYTVGIDDIASAPIDAMGQLVGSYPGPKTVAQGVFDLTDEKMPAPGTSCTISVPLHRPKFTKTVGHVKLEVRA